MDEKKSQTGTPIVQPKAPQAPQAKQTNRIFTAEELHAQSICSHDAPGQQPGQPCLRCGLALPK